VAELEVRVMERGEEGVELPMPDGGVTAEVAGPGLAGVLSDINPSLSFWTGLSDRQICNL
jgi:hypothetical protein